MMVVVMMLVMSPLPWCGLGDRAASATHQHTTHTTHITQTHNNIRRLRRHPDGSPRQLDAGARPPLRPGPLPPPAPGVAAPRVGAVDEVSKFFVVVAD